MSVGVVETDRPTMISELVAELSKILDEHGDLPTFIYNGDYCYDIPVEIDEIKVVEAGIEGWTKYEKHVSLGRYDE